jgi:hypothetical protein
MSKFKKIKERHVNAGCRLPETMLKIIDELCLMFKTNRSEIIKWAVHDYEFYRMLLIRGDLRTDVVADGVHS